MTITSTAPYGGWRSPITAQVVTGGAPRREHPVIVDGVLYWQEARPEQNGRTCVVARTPDGREQDILPSPLSTRSKVNEYGGKSWLVTENRLYFVLQDDQRLYCLDLDQAKATPQPLTPDNPALRYADLEWDPQCRRILCVLEQHFDDVREPRQAVAAISVDGQQPPRILAEGADFYAYPRLSPRGDKLCWIQWHHPNMPWDATELVCAEFDADGLPAATRIIAGNGDEAIFQPCWSPKGELYFVSDHCGWWNLYRHRADSNQAILPMTAEFGLPLWSLGMSTYSFVADTQIAVLYSQNGSWQLGVLDTISGQFETVETPYLELSSLTGDPHTGTAAMIGASPLTPGDVITLDADSKSLRIIKDASDTELAPFISTPRAICFPTANNDEAHGFYYPPHNPHYRSPDNERPPLVVMCHGGPTGATSGALNYKIQYWTSRGFALLDVNYRGSTGYGRAYREKLSGQWGIADVEDVAAGVRHLVNQGLADPLRTVIRGSSAGGYTVLAALTFTNVFRAGASLYGIGNLETLATDTHKFESRYLDKLVGPYPEARALYQARSPLFHTDQLNCPIIFLQGLEDKVVPPAQAESMVRALRKKGIAVAYITFADEGHGFRKAANIKKAMESELCFYRSLLGIPSCEDLPKITIENRR